MCPRALFPLQRETSCAVRCNVQQAAKTRVLGEEEHLHDRLVRGTAQNAWKIGETAAVKSGEEQAASLVRYP